MNAQGGVADSEAVGGPGMKFYLLVWLGLIGIVIVEVLLTYAGLSPLRLTISLIALALIEGGVALMYFMQLKYERKILFWSTIPALLFVLVMFDHLWPDAFRVTSMRQPISASSTPASSQQ